MGRLLPPNLLRPQVDRFDSTSWCLLEPDISVGWAAGGLVAPSGGSSGAARAAPSASPAGGGAAPDGEVESRQARRLKLANSGPNELVQFYGAGPLPVAAAVFRREVLVHRDHWRTPECIAVLQSLHPRVGRWSPIGSLGEDNLRHILELTFSTPQGRT